MVRFKKYRMYLLYFLALIPIYLLVALLLSYIPYNTDFQQEQTEPITIYLHSNGVHTDILVPIENNYYNWTTRFMQIPPSAQWAAVGWGDKGFYLNTPTWGDLTVNTAFRAAFGLSTTAMHISYYDQPMALSQQTVKLTVNKEQYLSLCNYIESSFQKNEQQQAILIPHNPAYYTGNFYEAEGTYSIFTSCNSWVNKGLKKSGVRTCFWTPFDWPLLRPFY